MVGSASQVGAEESIQCSEKHPDQKRQRVIQDSIVEDKFEELDEKRSCSSRLPHRRL